MIKRFIFNVVAATLLVASTAQAQDATLDRARQMIDARQFVEAFALLDPLEGNRAGDPAYDFLLGLAAIDAGQLTRAVFALERVLAVRPADARARAEIARAYFLMGEGQNARREFAAVKQQQPPAEVASTIDRFLSTLDIRGDRPPSDREGFTGYLEGGYGNDSNANSATGVSSFAIPLFPGATFNLGAGASSQRANFMTLAAGISGRKFLSPRTTLFGNASFDQRTNESLDTVDTRGLNGTLGVTYERDADEFTFAAQAQGFDVDQRRFRNSLGGIAQWRRNLGAFDQLTTYLQYTWLEYPNQRNRDANRSALGLAYAHTMDHPLSPVFFASAYGGSEDEKAAGVPQFGHRFIGGRLGGQVDLSKTLRFTANLSYEERSYGGPDPLFLVDRKDRESSLRLSLPWEVAPLWTLTPQVSFTDNRSNLVISDYQRTQMFVTLRRDFR